MKNVKSNIEVFAGGLLTYSMESDTGHGVLMLRSSASPRLTSMFDKHKTVLQSLMQVFSSF